MRRLALMGLMVAAGCGGVPVQPVTLEEARTLVNDYCSAAWEAKAGVGGSEASEAEALSRIRAAAGDPANRETIARAIGEKLRAIEVRSERLAQRRNSISIQGRALTAEEQEELDTIERELEYLAHAQRCVTELRAQLEPR